MKDEAAIASLVAAAQGGDAAAVDALLREFRPRIFRYVLARLGDVHLSEDVVQETCMAVVRALPTFEDRGVRVSSFVFTIASNKIVDLLRRQARRPAVTDDSALADRPDDADGPEELAVRAAEVRRLAAPLARLSDRDRDIILLRVVGLLSAEEVGQTLGMSPGAVRVAQHRALKTLRSAVEEVPS